MLLSDLFKVMFDTQIVSIKLVDYDKTEIIYEGFVKDFSFKNDYLVHKFCHGPLLSNKFIIIVTIEEY